MSQIETWLKSDLQEPIRIVTVHGNVFTQDNMANRIGVEVTDGGAAASLSGTVSGLVIRQDDTTIGVTGTLSGNKAYVDLPEAAYAVPGQIQVAIRLTTGNTKTVLGACTGNVVRSQTGTVVDPGNAITDRLPALPTANGTYNLRCVKSNSGTTLSWVADS